MKENSSDNNEETSSVDSELFEEDEHENSIRNKNDSKRVRGSKEYVQRSFESFKASKSTINKTNKKIIRPIQRKAEAITLIKNQ